MEFSIIGYDPIGAWLKTADTMEELLPYRNTGGITWIQVKDVRDGNLLTPLIDCFGIHPLTVEDILDTQQRPKAEEFDTYLFITFKEARLRDEADAEPEVAQISLILTKDTVITFQQSSGISFDGIRRRILNNIGRTRRMGADYLAYLLMDTVVDTYFSALDTLGGRLEDFEDRALDENDAALIPDLQRIKQILLKIRRIIWPLRESLTTLLPPDSDLINPELEPFFKDLQDNVMQAVETVENYREILSGVMEVNLSALSNRMNKVMKVLTIISTIFIPLTFIVGVYGMNFAFMPELGYPYAYPIVWGVMILIVAGMLIFFKRRHWI
ncbi:MAG: magnesium/cobalt transporter CorA [Spirochaetaceae bacterium]|jgi:magnesium transporter|nr:magnesium/cobalt transporter CorA [Spirochaetaceae bacterium]